MATYKSSNQFHLQSTAFIILFCDMLLGLLIDMQPPLNVLLRLL